MSVRSLRQRPQRKVGETAEDSTNTEAEKSKRRGRKRGFYEKKNSAYDEYGNVRWSGADVCDCMNEECCGCWNQCANCGSTRCGPQCRVNRKFFYESIIYDGKELTVSNKHMSNSK